MKKSLNHKKCDLQNQTKLKKWAKPNLVNLSNTQGTTKATLSAVEGGNYVGVTCHATKAPWNSDALAGGHNFGPTCSGTSLFWHRPTSRTVHLKSNQGAYSKIYSDVWGPS